MRRAAGAPRAGPSARVVPVPSVSLRASPCVSVRRFRTSSCDVLGQRLRVDRLMTLRDPCGACPDTWRVRADTVRVRGAAPLESGTYVEPPARPPRTRRAHASRVHLSPGGAEHARYGTGTRWVRSAKSGERRGGCCAALGSAPVPRRGRVGAAVGPAQSGSGTAPEQLREGLGKASGRLRELRNGAVAGAGWRSWQRSWRRPWRGVWAGCAGVEDEAGGSGGEEGCACPAGSCQRTCQPGAAASCMAFLPCSVPIQVPPACL